MNDADFPTSWRELRPRQLLARLAVEPVIGAAFEALGRTLVDELDGRTLETIALRVSARRDCHYVWRGHCVIALNHPTQPLTVDEIARIAEGPSALTGADQVLVRAVDELLGEGLGALSKATLGSRALPISIATFFYNAVAVLMSDAAPEPDARPVRGLETPLIAVRAA
jgi:hypothetical protein